MVYYLFEDKDISKLSLYYKLYCKDTSNIIFTGCNEKLRKFVVNMKETDFAIIFLDINPWNKQLFSLYESLIDILEFNNKQLIVFPIACFELNFMLSIIGSDLIINRDKFARIFNVKCEDDFRRNGFRTYEKFAKDILSGSVSPDWYNEIVSYSDYVRYNLWYKFIYTFRAVPLSALNRYHDSTILDYDTLYELHLLSLKHFANWASSVEDSKIKRLRPCKKLDSIILK